MDVAIGVQALERRRACSAEAICPDVAQNEAGRGAGIAPSGMAPAAPGLARSGGAAPQLSYRRRV